MTRTEFGAVFARMARQYRVTDLDEQTVLDYYDALSGYPLDALRMAQEAFATDPGRRWLPTTGEWAERASACQREAFLHEQAPAAREVPWSDECSDCRDTGWVQDLTCDGREQGPCGSQRRHAPHDYVRICPCRPSNRTWRRHVQLGRA